MNFNLISVIIPCYDQVQYLDKRLQSVLEKKYQNSEAIIVNDKDLDNTNQIVQEWSSKDLRFNYLKKKNRQLSSARNVKQNLKIS